MRARGLVVDCARRRGGFTLVELVVAAGITIALAGIMISIVTNLMSSVSRSSGSLLANNQAKIALDFLAQDLQSAVMRADNNVWLAATVQPDQTGTGDSGAGWADWDASGGGVNKPGAASGSLQLRPDGGGIAPELQDLGRFRFGKGGVWLRLFSVEPDRNDALDQLSTVRAIGYQVVRYEVGSTAASTHRYGLYRASVRPFGASGSTFAVGYRLFSTSESDANPSPYNVGNGTAGNPGNVRRPNADTILADNVIDFGVRLWGRDGSVLFPEDSDNCGFAATASIEVPPEPDPWEPVGGAYMTYGFPEIAEVFLRVLTDDGARQIEALERGQLGARPAEYATDGEWWWAIAEANSRVYTRSVEMKARAL